MSEHISTKVKHKSRKLLFRVLFSRAMISCLLLLVQLGVLLFLYTKVSAYLDYYMTGFLIFSMIIIIFVINRDGRPEFKMAWMLPMCVFPIFGALLYILIQVNPGTIGLQRSMRRVKEATRLYCETAPEVTAALQESSPYMANLAYYMEHTGGAPTYQNTGVEYYPVGEDAFVAFKEELNKAKKFIFIEFFIISEGMMWETILDILKRKVTEGVEVRVMYDGTCAFASLPYSYAKKLQKYGIKAKAYAPIKPMLSTHQNNRDHRKILDIDGRVAFTGGINLADEYINQKVVYGYWKDTTIKVEGDAVCSMTMLFLQMWNVGETVEEDYAKYINIKTDRLPKEGDGFVIPYGDEPTNEEDVAEDVYRDMLNKACDYVHITTPYLIVDHEMLSAICFAAKRGVDVKIVIPHIPDKKIAFYIAKTFYVPLMKAGVKVYEYEPGFMHAKSFVADGKRAVVGSINLDYRSLYHHFECAVYMYKNKVIEDIERDFQHTIKQSILITPEEYKKVSVWEKIVGRVFKIFSPLM